MALSKKQLEKTAKEVNQVCEFDGDDVIDPNQKSKDLKNELIKVTAGDEENPPEVELLPEDDFSNEVWNILAELGCEVAQSVVGSEEEKNSSEEDENTEESEESYNEEEAEESGGEDEQEPDDEVVLNMTEEELDSYKKKDILQLIEDRELDVDTDQNVKNMKKEIKEKCTLLAEKKEEKSKKKESTVSNSSKEESSKKSGKKEDSSKKSEKKEEKSKTDSKKSEKKDKKKKTRVDAFYEAMQKGGTREELIEQIDEIYTNAGGSKNISGAKSAFDFYIPILLKFNIAEFDGKNYKIIK